MSALDLQCVAESTYRQSYRGQLPSIPVVKYKTLPCFYPPGSTEPCRQGHGDYKPIALKRVSKPVPVPQPSAPPICQPKSTTHQKMENKILETKFGPMDMETINRLYKKMRYSTFTQRAGQECPLPVHPLDVPNTTKEEKPDMIRLRGQKYDEAPADWQDAVLWDRIQTRAPTQPPTSPTPKKVLPRRQITNTLDKAVEDRIMDLVKKDALANVFVKKCPGYAGYAPLCPPETDLGDKKCPREMTSTMAASYSQFPDHALSTPQHARSGVLSKTITLTYPFNPFNKVGFQITAVNKESRYAGMDNYLQLLPAA